MPKTILDFVATASKGLVECSINEFRALAEFNGLGGLAALRRVQDICEQAGLVCNPPLDDGELDTPRTFRSEMGADEGPGLFDKACASGEGHHVEFKQTLGLNIDRLNARPDTPANELFDEKMVHEIVKTITAFLNADGGTLVIGMCDDGTPFGIQNEYKYIIGNSTHDGWMLRLGNSLSTYIPNYRIVLGYIRNYIVELDGNVFCVITVEPRRDRITVCKKSGSQDEVVYKRAGNSSFKLQASDIEALVMDRYRELRS